MDIIITPFLFILLALHIDEERDDATLAKRIKEGDHVAFRQFFDRYHGSLLAFLIKKGLDQEAAQDIVQNAFIKIWEGRDQIDPSKSIKAFLYKIGYTRTLNYFRDTAKFDQEADLTSRATDSSIYQQAVYNQMHDYLLKNCKQDARKKGKPYSNCAS